MITKNDAGATIDMAGTAIGSGLSPQN